METTLIILAALLYGELPHVNAIKTQCTIQCSLVIKHTNYFNILSLKTQWACLHAHHTISVLIKMLTCSTTIGIFLCKKHIPNSFSFLGIIENLLPIIMLHLRIFGQSFNQLIRSHSCLFNSMMICKMLGKRSCNVSHEIYFIVSKMLVKNGKKVVLFGQADINK